ncbi:PP2C family serine/threonine-protein phosphatase [uncultured Mitsuokella sp.]|uniref:PP2C family protein-serine/threonine phosphatase n=1 Tax=uncultured Mitsuokella sp. TaxID=453120 RepID=UPI002614FC71|nr:protein phosphatase 2C domain-containing protein [uncultured Mitsuokella sp.]
MEVYMHTVKGIHKEQNEDRILVQQQVYQDVTADMDVADGFVAVADGVGGNYGGAAAAQFLCEQVGRLARPELESFRAINEALLVYGREQSHGGKMAATFSGLFFGEGLPVLVHTGNTRVYAIQAGKYLRQLTRDDTVVQYLLDTGRLTEQEAESYAARNEITSCFGGGRPDLLRLTIRRLTDDAEQYLLTTDGVHEHVSTDELEDILATAEGDWLAAVKQMVQQSIVHHSADDCTAVILDAAV